MGEGRQLIARFCSNSASRTLLLYDLLTPLVLCNFPPRTLLKKNAVFDINIFISCSLQRKLARAKRFGLSPGGSTSTDISQLEKRAARFGEVLAPTLQKSVESERLQKRLERFGEASGKSSSASEEDKKQKRLERFQDSSVTKKSSLDEEERKRKRLERFGGSVASGASSSAADAEKLTRRANRFGLDSEEAKKAARAKRFGVSA